MASARLVLPKTIAGAAVTLRARLAVADSAVAFPESVTLNDRLEEPAPAAIGVPEITPAAVMVRPEGSVPVATDQV